MNKCRHNPPTAMDRLIRMIGINKDMHNWKRYNRKHKDIIYYCRRCECGAEQLQNAGPMGNKQWQDINKPLKHKWEQDSFNQSMPYIDKEIKQSN